MTGEHEETFTDDDETVDIDPEEWVDLAPEIPSLLEIKQDMKASGIKEEVPSSAKPILMTSGSSKSGTNVSPVTEDEIRSVLAVAPVTTQYLVSRFKSRLRGPEDKNAFAEILKKISKIQKTEGHNYIILRDERYESISIKEEAPSSSKPISKISGSSESGTNVSPVTEDEIRSVLLAVAPVTTRYLVSRFKSRLRGPEDMKASASKRKRHLQQNLYQRSLVHQKVGQMCHQSRKMKSGVFFLRWLQ